MNGLHFTILGAIGTVAISWWLIGHADAAFTIATGTTKAVQNVAVTAQSAPSGG